MSAIENLVAQQLARTNTAKDCKELEDELMTLLAQVKPKRKNYEKDDMKNGLNCTGRNAFCCDCGNTAKEDGAYVGICEDCQGIFCIKCLTKCESCCKAICSNDESDRDDACAVLCEGCEEVTLCSDCLQVCIHCKAKTCCEDCLRDTTAPFEDYVCPCCFDSIKYINM